MCPPQSVKMWPTPACLSVRATRCPPFRSAMGLLPVLARLLPELLPFDALAVHALLDEGVADGVDRVAAAADIDHEPVHAVDEPVHDGGGFARLAAPAGGRLAHRRHVGEAGVAPREGTELGIVEEPRGIACPVDQDRRTAVARLVEIGEDRPHRHDADLLGDEDGAARVGAVEDEAARRPLALYRVAGPERAEPLRAHPAG